MALVTHFDLELHQMDVKTAFLNGDIDETIYMVQPENFVSGDTKKMVCKLKKSIYGLKQASRQWYYKFHQVIISFGFEMNMVDDCIYHKYSGSKHIYLVLHVDDILWDPIPGLIRFGGSESSPGCPVITQSLKIKSLWKRFQFRANP